MTAPLHGRIEKDLESRILSGALGPGDRLPTELELAAEYGCARMTVHKAVSRLAAAGLVERRRRAGTFVARPRLHSMVLDIPDLPAEVARRGQAYRWRSLERAILPAGAAQDGSLAIGTPAAALRLVGVHCADGRPIAHEERLVSLALVPDIGDARFDEEPPGTWLLRHVPWTEAETRISVAAAGGAIADWLAVPRHTPLLVVARRTWRGGEGITAVRQSFLGDTYELVARFGAGS